LKYYRSSVELKSTALSAVPAPMSTSKYILVYIILLNDDDDGDDYDDDDDDDA
jgi:hypothetical protein